MEANIKLYALQSGFKSILHNEFQKNRDVLHEKSFDEGFYIFIDIVSEHLARNQLDEWPEHIRKERDRKLQIEKNLIDDLVNYDMEE